MEEGSASSGPLSNTYETTESKELLRLAKKIVPEVHNTNWKIFGRILGLSDYRLDDIETKNAQLPNILEVCCQLLLEWKQKFPEEFSEKSLVQKVKELKSYTQYPKGPSTIPHHDYTLEELKELRDTLESNQREEYSDRSMPVPPWLEERDLLLHELFVDLEMFVTDRRGREKPEGFVNVKNMFDLPESREAKEESLRILIEGDAGFGKTTLLLKMVDDWTKKVPYISDRFRMLFFIFLRNCKAEDSFEDLIMGECEGVDCEDPKKGLQCIKMFEKETLFLLDGYDELDQESRVNFERVLRRKEFKTSTVVVSSRRGLFKIERENTQAKGLANKKGKGGDRVSFWNKRVSIKGISSENRKLFLKRFFESDTDHVANHIISLAELDLYRCPLFLVFLATLRDEELVHTINTQTSLYVFLLNVITRRALFKTGEIDESDEVDLFDPHHPNYHSKTADLMQRFGQLTMQHLIHDHLTFTQEEIAIFCVENTPFFLQLGLLNRCPIFNNRKATICYEPIHKSLLEFFTAFYLFRLGTQPNGLGKKRFVDEIITWTESNQKSSDVDLVYPLLAGLLNGNSSLLFDVLLPWTTIYNPFDYFLFNMAKEITQIDNSLPSLQHYCPQYLNITNYPLICENNFSESGQQFKIDILKLFTGCNAVKVLDYDLKWVLKSSIKVNTLVLQMQQFHVDQQGIRFRKECNDLHCYFDWFNPSHWELVTDFLSTVHAGKMHFYFLFELNFMQEITNYLKLGYWKNLCEIYICLQIKITDPELSFLIDVFKKQSIPQKLIFYGWSRNGNNVHVTDEICVSASDSLEQTIFDLFHMCEEGFPFSRLCQNNKKWKRIIVRGNSISLAESSSNCSVEELKLDKVSSDITDFLLTHCVDVLSLRCNGTHFINSYVKGTPIFQSLQALRLDVDFEFFTTRDFSKIPRLRLRCLTLCFELGCLPDNNSVKRFMTFASESQIDVLEMSWRVDPFNFLGLLFLETLTTSGDQMQSLSIYTDMNQTRKLTKGLMELRFPFRILKGRNFANVLEYARPLMAKGSLNKLVFFDHSQANIVNWIESTKMPNAFYAISSVFRLAQNFSFSRGILGTNSEDATMLDSGRTLDYPGPLNRIETLVLTYKNDS